MSDAPAFSGRPTGRGDPARASGRAGCANLEIKARCADLDALRERARAAATRFVGVDEQVDTYFRVPTGRLKLRESSLSGGQLVGYLRSERAGVMRSDYRVIPVEDPEGVKAIFSGLLGVHRVVRKRREIYLADNVRIHLDRVERLGTFLELEAVWDGSAADQPEQERKLRQLMQTLDVRAGDLLATSYEALLADAP